MPSIPISQAQLNKLIGLHKDINTLISKRNDWLSIIIDGTDYAGLDVTVTEVNDSGIHFTLNGGDHSSSGDTAAEQLTLKLEE